MFIFGSRLESKFSSLQEGMIFYKFLILTLKFCNLFSNLYIQIVEFKIKRKKLENNILQATFDRLQRLVLVKN